MVQMRTNTKVPIIDAGYYNYNLRELNLGGEVETCEDRNEEEINISRSFELEDEG